MARTQRGGWLCEPATCAAGAELHATGPAGGPEGHVARLRLDTELGHQPQERGVRDVVVDDEPHVDRERSVRRVDHDGLDVAADRRLPVVQRDLVLAMQAVGGAQAADPGTDDRDAHQLAASSRRAARSSSAASMPAAASRPIFCERPTQERLGEAQQPTKADVRGVVDDGAVTGALEADLVDGLDVGARSDEDDPARPVEVANLVLHGGHAAAHPDRQAVPGAGPEWPVIQSTG